MTERYYLGAYWGPRKESPEEAAARLESALRDLGTRYSLLADWYLKAPTRESSLESPAVIAPDALAALLRESDQGDAGELGYSLAIWNAAPDEAAVGLSLHVGSSAPALVNSLVLQLPRSQQMASELFASKALIDLVATVARAFQPRVANLNSNRHRRLSRRSEGRNAVGWILYLGCSLDDLPELPVASVLPLNSLGVILVITRERFSSANPEHVRLAEETARRLEESGLLPSAAD